MDTNTGTAPATDPLNEELAGIDTNFPLWQVGQLLEFKVSEASVAEPTDPTKAPRLKITLETLSPCKSQDGADLQPGVKCFESAQLLPTGKATKEIVEKNVAAIMQGIGAVRKGDGRGIGNIREWIGQIPGLTFKAKTKINPARTDPNTGKSYEAQNAVSYVKQS